MSDDRPSIKHELPNQEIQVSLKIQGGLKMAVMTVTFEKQVDTLQLAATLVDVANHVLRGALDLSATQIREAGNL